MTVSRAPASLGVPWRWGVVVLCLLAACNENNASWGPSADTQNSLPESLNGAAVGLAPPPNPSPPSPEASAALRQRPITFRILLIQVPHAKAAAVAQIWSHLREDAVDARTQLRLQQNALRLGVGVDEWWGPIRAIFDSIDGHRVSNPEPYRVPQRLPLHLELDDGVGVRTVFAVGEDNVLTGGIWPESRCSLQLTHVLDLLNAERDLVTIVPAVRQPRPGWRAVPTESGVWSTPEHEGRLFTEAGFTIGLLPGEFLVLGPSENADVAGILGRTFLTRDVEGVPFDYYVIIRPDVNDGGERE